MATRMVAILAAALAFGGAMQGQQDGDGSPALPSKIQAEETQPNATAPCLQPPPLVGWEDYQGPMRKVVGAFARKLERKAAHPPV